MKLEIILRIHDGQNIHGDKPRYIDIPKKDLILGCLTSLINSANVVTNAEISFVVLNDHCTYDCISKVHKIFSHSKHPYQLIDLEVKGFHHSGLKQFEYCKNSTADLVYSVEDDYLHSPSALFEMLSEYDYVSSKYNLPQPLCIFPWDQPEDYEPRHNTPELIMRGQYRHWKTGWGTTYTMMTSPKVFHNHWNLFEKLATEYKEWDGTGNKNDTIHEGNTISYIWSKHIIRINPIPSLVLHMQSSLQEDSYIDWKYWWKTYTHKAKHFELSYL